MEPILLLQIFDSHPCFLQYSGRCRTNIKRQADGTGNDIALIWKHLNFSKRASDRFVVGHGPLIHFCDELCGSRHRVFSQMHRCRACMILMPVNCDFANQKPYNRGDQTDLLSALLQHTALFNMQFDKAFNLLHLQ